MELGYLDDIKYKEMYEAEDKLDFLIDFKESLPETEDKYIASIVLDGLHVDSYVKPYADSFIKKITDQYINPGILSHIKQQIDLSIEKFSFDFTDKNYLIFKNNKENMEEFYYKVKNTESIRLVSKSYEKIDEEFICKLEKNNDKEIITAIWINNKKYSYGIFYEKENGHICFWHLNEQGYYERVGIYYDTAIIWTADDKGEIYKETLGTRIDYMLHIDSSKQPVFRCGNEN